MKHVFETERKMLLKLFLLLFFIPLASMAWGQSVDNGGGKVHVDTGEGDPGGPWGPSMERIQMCLEHGTCDTLEVEGFVANAVMLTNSSGAAWPGFSFQILGLAGGVQSIQICIDGSAPTGEANLVIVDVPLTTPGLPGGTGSNGDPTTFLSIRAFVSVACPNYVDLVEEEPNGPR